MANKGKGGKPANRTRSRKPRAKQVSLEKHVLDLASDWLPKRMLPYEPRLSEPGFDGVMEDLMDELKARLDSDVEAFVTSLRAEATTHRARINFNNGAIGFAEALLFALPIRGPQSDLQAFFVDEGAANDNLGESTDAHSILLESFARCGLVSRRSTVIVPQVLVPVEALDAVGPGALTRITSALFDGYAATTAAPFGMPSMKPGLIDAAILDAFDGAMHGARLPKADTRLDMTLLGIRVCLSMGDETQTLDHFDLMQADSLVELAPEAMAMLERGIDDWKVVAASHPAAWNIHVSRPLPLAVRRSIPIKAGAIPAVEEATPRPAPRAERCTDAKRKRPLPQPCEGYVQEPAAPSAAT